MSGTTQKSHHAAWWILGFLLFMAIFQEFLANGIPLYCRIGGAHYWPGVESIWKKPEVPYSDTVLNSIRVSKLWRTYPYEAVVFAPVPFSPAEIAEPFFPPGTTPAAPGTLHPGLPDRFRHWLGTDERGRDVLAGVIAGARSAIITGSVAMLMAVGIGLLLGALAGFWGDDRLRIRRGTLWMSLLGLLMQS